MRICSISSEPMSTPASATTLTNTQNTSTNTSNSAATSISAQNSSSANTSATSKPSPEEIIPCVQTLQHAAKLAIQQDKKIMLDYYVESLNEKAFIGEDLTSKERVLIKTRKDFTSLVQKIYKVGEDYLILTENSIYVVSTKIKKRPINLSSLDYDYNDEE